MTSENLIKNFVLLTLSMQLMACEGNHLKATGNQVDPTKTATDPNTDALEAVGKDNVLTSKDLPLSTNKIFRRRDFVARDVDRNYRIKLNGVNYIYSLFENPDFQCGDGENYTFFVIQRADKARTKSDNWFYLRGGGIGYYYQSGEDLLYLPGGEGINRSPDAEKFMSSIEEKVLLSNGQPRHNVLGRRLAEGSRVISLAYCDHDIYMGAGHSYPNNPVEGTTVDGLTATTSSILYASQTFPTDRTWLHGTSAGSAGSYNVSRALVNHGLTPAGVLLDSFTLNSFAEQIAANQCKPYREEIEQILGLTAEQQMANIYLKAIGTLDESSIESLKKEYLENYLGDPKAPPYFVIQGENDDYCCGSPGRKPLSPEAETLGGNCHLVNSVFDKGLKKGTPSAMMSRKLIAPGFGHVVTMDSSARANKTFHGAIESWIREIRGQ